MDREVERGATEQLLAAWANRSHKALDAHYNMARRYERLHRWILGVGGAAVGAAASILAAISAVIDAGSGMRISVAVLVGGAVLLAAIQHEVSAARLAAEHRKAGAEFARARRRIEALQAALADRAITSKQLDDEVRAIGSELKEIAKRVPPPPRRAWSEAHKRLRGKRVPPGGAST